MKYHTWQYLLLERDNYVDSIFQTEDLDPKTLRSRQLASK